MMATTSSSIIITTQASLIALSQKTQGDPALQELIQRIPPSTFYKSDQLQDAYTTMMALLDDNDNDDTKSVMLSNDAISYYLQTLHVASHEILGHVHISLAYDVYQKLSKQQILMKQPAWCRLIYEILNTHLEVKDDDLILILEDWIQCGAEHLRDVEEYLQQSNRSDLWDRLNLTAAAVQQQQKEEHGVSTLNSSLTTSSDEDNEVTNGEVVVVVANDDNVSDISFSPPEQEDSLPDLPPRELFYLLVEKLEGMMNQDRINATNYYPTVYLAVEALKQIDAATEEDLRAGLLVTSSCLLRRDATWIFRFLDQRGIIQRDDLYQLLHVYCNDHRQPFGIQYALSLLNYCEKKSGKNAYIRRPDPIMYRMVLKAIGENVAYGFGHRALNVMKSMSRRDKAAAADDHDVDSTCWKPVFDDHASAVSAFVDDSQSWASVQRADGLVRSLYTNPVGMRETPATTSPPRLEHLVRVGQKLRIVPLVPHNTPGPLYKVLKTYKEDSTNSEDRVVAAISLFEFAVEQTAAGNGTLEELSKFHFFVIVDLCRRTNTFLVQECVRLFTRVDQLVEEGLLSRDLVSPSVSYQILSLLAAGRSPGHIASAESILDHYISRTKDPRLAAFQYAIQCCCAENSTLGCSKAVHLLERAMRTFRRKPFRDSFFVDTLQQLELHDTEGKHAAKIYNILNHKLYNTSLDVDSRIAILMSSYRCLQKDPSSGEKVKDVVAKLAKLRELNPNHPAFASSGECVEATTETMTTELTTETTGAIMVTAESGQTTSAIDILLSSKEAGDIVMAESILEQGEADGTPHAVQTYQQVIEAFIGNNDMTAATNVLRRMKKFHGSDDGELESNVFDILLSSGQPSDMELAESMVRWTNNDRSDLCNKVTKMVYTCLSLGSQQGRDTAERVLDHMSDELGTDDEVWVELNQVVSQASNKDEINDC